MVVCCQTHFLSVRRLQIFWAAIPHHLSALSPAWRICMNLSLVRILRCAPTHLFSNCNFRDNTYKICIC
jgi:hypothetical protein